MGCETWFGPIEAHRCTLGRVLVAKSGSQRGATLSQDLTARENLRSRINSLRILGYSTGGGVEYRVWPGEQPSQELKRLLSEIGTGPVVGATEELVYILVTWSQEVHQDEAAYAAEAKASAMIGGWQMSCVTRLF